MKTLLNNKIFFKDKPVTDENGHEFDVLSLIKIVLENSAYDTTGSLMQANKIYGKLAEKDGTIDLEDADYEFIKKWTAVYVPLLQKGLIFTAFYEALEK